MHRLITSDYLPFLDIFSEEKQEEPKKVEEVAKVQWNLESYIPAQERQDVIFETRSKIQALHKSIHKSINNKKTVKFEASKINPKSKNTYSCISLANFIAKEKYIAKTKNSCGASVWNMLTAFWIKWLPNQDRDWHKWDEFLENRADFVKVPISDPREANPGAILVYDKWHGSWARKKYWHVEIATKDGFYYGKFTDIPGWSAKDWFKGYAYYYIGDNSRNNIG